MTVSSSVQTDGRRKLHRRAVRLDVVDGMTRTGPAGSSLDTRRSRTAGTAMGAEMRGDVRGMAARDGQR
jgi:hypothetical protein